MSGNDEEVLSIPIDVKGIDDAEEAANTLEKLRDAMRGATDSLRANQAALRSLKGSSDEVKAARDALKAAIQGEQDAISAGTLKLLKAGTTYEQLAQAEKKATAEAKRLADEQKKLAHEQDKAHEQAKSEELKKLGESMRAAGGPANGLRDKVASLGSALSTGAGMAMLAVGAVVALGAAIGAAAVAIARGIVQLAQWTIETANAQRAMGLLREAVGGTAANGEALGTWVDQLARKLPLSTEKLNELATNITRTFNGTMVGGQGIVDTFQAVAGASAAMGDQAGAAIQSIIDRGKQFGRGGVGLFELQGTGLQFDKLAAHVAKAMHLTMQQARMQLASGMVPIETLAASLKDTVNERFGEINAKKFLDLNSITERFHDRLAKLTKGFDMTPILQSLEKLSSLFDDSTVTGDALKQMMTVFGQLLGATFKEGTPLAVQFFEQVIIYAQRAVIEGLKFGLVVKRLFDNPESAGMLQSLAAIPEMILAISNPLQLVTDMFDELAHALDLTAKATEMGENLITGFVQGVKNGWNGAVDAVKGLAQGVMGAFTGKLLIQSPSKVFAEYGEQTTAGYVQGVEGSAGDASAATARMAPSPSGGRAAGRGGGGVSFGDINVTVNAAPGASGQEMGQQAAESFKSRVLAFFEELGAAEGNPTQTVEAT